MQDSIVSRYVARLEGFETGNREWVGCHGSYRLESSSTRTASHSEASSRVAPNVCTQPVDLFHEQGVPFSGSVSSSREAFQLKRTRLFAL